MGRAFAVGLVRAHPELAASLLLSDAFPAAADAAASETGGQVTDLATAACAECVVLAVKPKDVEAALTAAQPSMGAKTVLLSVVAGWTLDRLAAAAPGVGLARTMPNLAVRHGSGIVVVATRGLSTESDAGLHALLDGLGTVVDIPESLFNAATGLAGCGPGFLALVAEGLEEGGVTAGLGRTESRAIVQGLLAGTASLLADGGDPAELRQRVSSPGGATIEGVGVLERAAVRAALADAVTAAARKTGMM
jgi:pyrroline-5-carboxylate reductase